MFKSIEMKHIIIGLLFLLPFTKGIAQEFNVTVQVTSPMVEGSEKKIFETLQQELYDFVNNTQWTISVTNLKNALKEPFS